MKARRYIAWILMVVSVVMLTASVLPHHHHREILCLQPDVAECGCACADADCPAHDASEDAHACGVGCVTEFHGVMPDESSDSALPHYAFCSLLYTAADAFILSLRLSEGTPVSFSPYVERLHSTCQPQVAGLRAPPCVLV